MSFQAYIDNIYAKTGKKPEEFLEAAKIKGLMTPETKVMQIVDWLKADYSLGHGHAMAIVQSFKNMNEWPVTKK
jgi:hypothetical protein